MSTARRPAPRSHSSTSSTQFSNPPARLFRSGPRGQRDIDDLIQLSRVGAPGRFDRHAAHDGDQVARQSRGVSALRQIILAKRALQPLLDGLAQTVAAIASSPAAPNRRCRNRRARPEPLDTLAGSPGWRETPQPHARGRPQLRAPSGLESSRTRSERFVCRSDRGPRGTIAPCCQMPRRGSAW